MGVTTGEAEGTKAIRLDPRATRLVPDCGCEEKVVIFDQAEDRLSRDPDLKCACGERLTVADNAKEEHCASFGAS